MTKAKTQRKPKSTSQDSLALAPAIFKTKSLEKGARI